MRDVLPVTQAELEEFLAKERFSGVEIRNDYTAKGRSPNTKWLAITFPNLRETFCFFAAIGQWDELADYAFELGCFASIDESVAPGVLLYFPTYSLKEG